MRAVRPMSATQEPETLDVERKLKSTSRGRYNCTGTVSYTS
jgi:hypothetical protein